MLSRFFLKKGASLKARAPRVTLSPLHHISFQPQGKNKREDLPPELPVANISTTGIGLLVDQKTPISDGDLVEGTLSLGERTFEVTLKVAFHTHHLWGCSFDFPAPKSEPGYIRTQTIAKYLEAEISALNLARVPDHSLDQAQDGKVHWYFGENNTELYYVEKNEELLRFHFVFLGHYVEGLQGRSAQIGTLVDEGPSDQPKFKPSTLIHLDSHWSKTMKELSLRFISHIQAVPASHREQLQKWIEKSPTK